MTFRTGDAPYIGRRGRRLKRCGRAHEKLVRVPSGRPPAAGLGSPRTGSPRDVAQARARKRALRRRVSVPVYVETTEPVSAQTPILRVGLPDRFSSGFAPPKDESKAVPR